MSSTANQRGDVSQLPRIEEIDAFLKIAESVDTLGPEEANLKRLFEVADVTPYSTALGRLKGLIDFLFNDDFPDKSLTPEARLRLVVIHNPQGGLALTPFGKSLKDRLKALKDSCSDLQHTAQAAWNGDGAATSRVAAGAPQMIAIRLISSALSQTEGLLTPSQHANLEVTIGNSRRDLIPQLYLGRLDCVVGYGPPAGAMAELGPEDRAVRFVPLGYTLRMICVCHPRAELWLRTGDKIDINKGYWDDRLDKSNRSRSTKGRRRVPDPADYGTLREIDPHAIDFRRSPLVAVPSWRQREAMEMLEDSARRHGGYREVTWYDESLAYVRMKAGIAFVPEVYVRRNRVNAFKLLNETDYAREVGFYYNREFGLTGDAYRFLEFLRAYFLAYGGRAGGPNEIGTEPPAIGHLRYPDDIKKHFDRDRDFDAEADTLYPPMRSATAN